MTKSECRLRVSPTGERTSSYFKTSYAPRTASDPGNTRLALAGVRSKVPAIARIGISFRATGRLSPSRPPPKGSLRSRNLAGARTSPIAGPATIRSDRSPRVTIARPRHPRGPASRPFARTPSSPRRVRSLGARGSHDRERPERRRDSPGYARSAAMAHSAPGNRGPSRHGRFCRPTNRRSQDALGTRMLESRSVRLLPS